MDKELVDFIEIAEREIISAINGNIPEESVVEQQSVANAMFYLMAVFLEKSFMEERITLHEYGESFMRLLPSHDPNQLRKLVDDIEKRFVFSPDKDIEPELDRARSLMANTMLNRSTDLLEKAFRDGQITRQQYEESVVRMQHVLPYDNK